MSPPSPVSLAAVAVLLAVTWVALGPVRPTPRPDRPTARAVDALVHDSATAARDVVPPTFAEDRGYEPVLRSGTLVRPDGDCSSPVPLPRAFDLACQRHDLGYDLLRHAAAVGGALPPGARAAVDQQFTSAALDGCRDETTWPATGCAAMASVAGMALAVNTFRQHGSTPSAEDARSVAEGTLGGSSVVAGLWALVLACVRVVRRVRATTSALVSRVARSLPAPPVVPVVATLVATTASLSPSYVPRSAVVQGVTTAVFVGVALLAARRWRHSGPSSATRRRVVLATSLATVVTVVAMVQLGDAPARAAMGLTPTGPAHWLTAGLVVVALTAVRFGARRAWRHRGRWWRPALVAITATALVAPASPAMAAPRTEGSVLEQVSAVGAVRAYAGLADGRTPRERAVVAVDRLEERGGLDRSRVVLAVPTGSGWVDPAAVDGFERRFGSDVALVSVQYAAVPSWVAYLLHQREARESAQALFDELRTRIAARPASRRPVVHLYGESLGAVAGQSVLAGTRDPDGTVCSALWVGPPGGRGSGRGREAVVANATDPVAHVTPWLAVRPDGDRPWVPVVSFVLTAGDLADSLAPSVGWGHRYGPDQVDALPSC